MSVDIADVKVGSAEDFRTTINNNFDALKEEAEAQAGNIGEWSKNDNYKSTMSDRLTKSQKVVYCDIDKFKKENDLTLFKLKEGDIVFVEMSTSQN